MALWYGRPWALWAGRLTAKTSGFWPGQPAEGCWEAKQFGENSLSTDGAAIQTPLSILSMYGHHTIESYTEYSNRPAPEWLERPWPGENYYAATFHNVFLSRQAREGLHRIC
jgi:hypothetical protein